MLSWQKTKLFWEVETKVNIHGGLTWALLHKGVNMNTGSSASRIKHDAVKSVCFGIYRAHIRWKEILKPHYPVWMWKNKRQRGKCQCYKDGKSRRCHLARTLWGCQACISNHRAAEGPEERKKKKKQEWKLPRALSFKTLSKKKINHSIHIYSPFRCFSTPHPKRVALLHLVLQLHLTDLFFQSKGFSISQAQKRWSSLLSSISSFDF